MPAIRSLPTSTGRTLAKQPYQETCPITAPYFKELRTTTGKTVSRPCFSTTGYSIYEVNRVSPNNH